MLQRLREGLRKPGAWLPDIMFCCLLGCCVLPAVTIACLLGSAVGVMWAIGVFGI